MNRKPLPESFSCGITLNTALAVAELAFMAAAILLDLLIPSILVALAGAVFVLVRKERMPVTKPPAGFKPLRFTLKMFLWAVAWTAVQYSLIMPIQNHLLHDTRNVDSFASVHGNFPNLLLFLLLSWAMAAVIEEIAFRGFFQNRIISLFSGRKFGMIIAVILTSALFGAMHAEQGAVGVIITAVDSVFFSVIRYHYQSVWASVLVHGFLNTIGLIAFFIAGSLYGLW